jgi:hypothetical protein
MCVCACKWEGVSIHEGGIVFPPPFPLTHATLTPSLLSLVGGFYVHTHAPHLGLSAHSMSGNARRKCTWTACVQKSCIKSAH